MKVASPNHPKNPKQLNPTKNNPKKINKWQKTNQNPTNSQPWWTNFPRWNQCETWKKKKKKNTWHGRSKDCNQSATTSSNISQRLCSFIVLLLPRLLSGHLLILLLAVSCLLCLWDWFVFLLIIVIRNWFTLLLVELRFSLILFYYLLLWGIVNSEHY